MLFIIRGLPGSGKSTIAKKLLRSGAATKHFEADMYFIEDGEYKYDPTRVKAAHEWCQQCVLQSLKQGDNVVVSNTFVKKWEVQPYLNMVESLGMDHVIIVATGTYENVHAVPQEVLERMNASWEHF